MKTQYFDRQDVANPLNGMSITNLSELRSALESARGRPPFFVELIGDNGFKLLLGIGGNEGCAQFSSVAGAEPYLMAVSPDGDAEGERVFLIGDTASPVPKRYCFPHGIVEDIAATFVQTGQRKSDLTWEEI
jgi:Immunity protein Imm1